MTSDRSLADYADWLNRPAHPKVEIGTEVVLTPPELRGLRGTVRLENGSHDSWGVSIPYGEDGSLIYVHKADVAPVEEMVLDLAVPSVSLEVLAERVRQDAKWGEQNHPNGTHYGFKAAAENARYRCQQAFRTGKGTWRHILDEEVQEAFAESDPVKLRVELLQVAAVAQAWVQAIDRASL